MKLTKLKQSGFDVDLLRDTGQIYDQKRVHICSLSQIYTGRQY